MTIDRISSFSLQQSLLGGSNKVLGDLLNLQQQLSSGYKASSYAELGGGQTQILTNLTNKLQRSQTYQQNNALIISRLQNTNQALSNTIDVANNILSVISQRRNDAIASSIPFDQLMQDARSNITAQLSTNVEGRYLFSGDNTSTPPIRTPIPDPAQIGVPDNSYYQGGAGDLTVQVQDNQSLTYNVRGDDPAFQKLYAGIAQALKAGQNDDDAGLASAYNLIQAGLHGVTGLQARTNTNIVNLQDLDSQQQSFRTYWQNASDNIDKTDIVAVSTQVALDQSTLTASYQAFSKIVTLRLSDYLR